MNLGLPDCEVLITESSLLILNYPDSVAYTQKVILIILYFLNSNL